MANDDSGRGLERPVMTTSGRGGCRDFAVSEGQRLCIFPQLRQALGDGGGSKRNARQYHQ